MDNTPQRHRGLGDHGGMVPPTEHETRNTIPPHPPGRHRRIPQRAEPDHTIKLGWPLVILGLSAGIAATIGGVLLIGVGFIQPGRTTILLGTAISTITLAFILWAGRDAWTAKPDIPVLDDEE